MQWEEVGYEILDYESNQTSTFSRGLHEFSFLEMCNYVNKTTLLKFDCKKYTSNSIWFYYLLNSNFIFSFCACQGIENMP